MKSKLCLLPAIGFILLSAACAPPAPTPQPTVTPTPVSTTIANVCNYKYATVTGQITIELMQTRSDIYNLLMRYQEGDQVYLLGVNLGVGTSPNSIEPLPGNYKATDVRIHTNSGGIAYNSQTVTLAGDVSVLKNPLQGRVPCVMRGEMIEAR